MIWVGIRDLKTHLSEYVHDVGRGEEVIVTDRGKPVARIIGDVAPRQGVRTVLTRLAENGLVDLPRKLLRSHKGLPITAKGKRASDLILEGRR